MQIRFKTKTFQVLHTPALSFGIAEGAEDVVPLLRAIFRDACDADREHFIVVALDARSRILGTRSSPRARSRPPWCIRARSSMWRSPFAAVLR